MQLEHQKFLLLVYSLELLFEPQTLSLEQETGEMTENLSVQLTDALMVEGLAQSSAPGILQR